MQPLKIAMVTDRYDHSINGGVLSVKRFTEALSKNHTVHVISGSVKRADSVSLKSFYPPFGKKVMEQNGFSFALPHTQKIRHCIKECDIVHIQFPFLLGMRALRIARALGKPVICSFHVQPENILLGVGIRNKFISNLLYHFFIKRFYGLADSVQCPSAFARNELITKGLKTDSFVLTNGILPRFNPILKFRSKKNSQKFTVISVGRLSPEKRQMDTLNAVGKLKCKDKIEVILIGKGPEEELLKLKAKQMGINAIIGYQSDEKLVELLNKSDLYIHSSEVELESMSTLEAMGVGLPLLISNSETSAAKQFALNETFVYQASNSQDLADKIEYHMKHRDLLAQSAAEYLEKSKSYRFENAVKKVEDKYFSVIRNHQLNRRKELPVCTTDKVSE